MKIEYYKAFPRGQRNCRYCYGAIKSGAIYYKVIRDPNLVDFDMGEFVHLGCLDDYLKQVDDHDV